MATETLRCRAGHDFHRELVRGKKPVWCPDHRPTAPKPATARTQPQSTPVVPVVAEVEEAEKPQRPAYSATTLKTYVTEADEAIDHPGVTEELKIKLRYIVREMGSGRRDADDVKSLNTTRRLYMNDARRMMGQHAS